MRFTVRSSPTQPPLLDTNDATWAEIRDPAGYLVMMAIFMPDGSSFLISTKNDQDFETVASNFNIPLHKAPADKG
jgi:hypothetical protein